MLQNKKKGQILIFSALFLLVLLLFIYSLETQNSYKRHLSKFDLRENLITETCELATLSNGSVLDERFSDFETSVGNYCSNFSYTCEIGITKLGGAPANTSELNESHYSYSLNYTKGALNYSGSFSCLE